MSDFPVDDATLVMLAEACRINPDLGRTTLHDFLDMGSRVASSEQIDDGDEGAPVYLVEHEPGYAPYSPNQVILALVAEIQRLRESGQ